MFRYSQSCEVLYGHWDDAVTACDTLNKLASDKGIRPARVLAPVVGHDNRLILEIEYDDLAQYERETARFYGDADLMGAYRKLAAQVVQGSSESALYMDAPHVS